MDYDLNVVLNSISLATDDEGLAENPVSSRKRKPLDKGKELALGKGISTAIDEGKWTSRGRHLKDALIDPLDKDLLDDQIVIHDIHFFATKANMDLEIIRISKAQEDEIDTLRSTLACVQEEAVTHCKASLEFTSCMYISASKLLRYPLRSATIPKEEKPPLGYSSNSSAHKRGKLASSVSKSVGVFDLSDKKPAKPPNSRKKFSVLSSSSYWLSHIKLSEAAAKHLISLGFLKLALEAGCEFQVPNSKPPCERGGDTGVQLDGF
ncbi:Uncharacterized protein Fot_19987 [Forsythia ovata]|uniref:Uncharacterized protein n=1 Tax=Forsythia ovata TaxID=205694 RepID=A0ABD1VMV2_9LAMI